MPGDLSTADGGTVYVILLNFVKFRGRAFCARARILRYNTTRARGNLIDSRAAENEIVTTVGPLDVPHASGGGGKYYVVARTHAFSAISFRFVTDSAADGHT